MDMKKMILCFALPVLFIMGMYSPASAALELQPPEMFQDPAITGIGNLLIPEFVNVPIAANLGSTDCLFGGTIGIDIDTSVSFNNAGYSVYFDEAGSGELVVEGTAEDIELDGVLTIVVDDCEIIPFIPISFDLDISTSNVTADTAYVGFISTPYLNTDTDEIVLDTRDDSIVGIFGLEILWDLLGLEEFIEGLFELWLNDYISDLLLGDGVVALTGDGGPIHDFLEDFMDTTYLPHLPCGCVTLTTSTPTAGHVIANMCFYLLPVGLILGLRRWIKA